MLPIALSFLLGPALASVASQAPRPRSLVTRGEGYIRATINPITGVPNLRKRSIERRATEADVINQQDGTRYAIDVAIGTPPQTLTLILDTGSPDLWVNPRCDTTFDPQECVTFPQFDYTKSSTLKTSGFADVLSYGKGNVTIEYVADTVSIGSASVTAQIFGVGLDSYDIPLGILGLSPPVNPNNPNSYPFLLDTMAAEGLIKSRAFSLDLRSVTEPYGAIIFGGLDTGKFSGPLVRLPMLDPSQVQSGADRYWIVMTGIGMTFPDGTADRSGEIEVAVFPDSGGTLSRLPTPIFQAIGESFPTAQFDRRSGFYIIDCSVLDEAGTVDFYFSDNLRIAVSYRDFSWHLTDGSCVLGILPDDDEPVLGDSFLRAAYVVHDQDNRALHIAQAANCGTSIVSIGSGSRAVPSVTGKCAPLDIPTATIGLDATNTREPTNVFTGSSPDTTGLGVGPGPAGGRTTVSAGGLRPTGAAKNGAGNNMVNFGFGGLLGLAAVMLSL
ncbi:hypothetical protein OQA88_2614 [Cercophora sp. LCS_1]